MDVFYDYLLARHWDRFCDQSLREFTRHFHGLALLHAPALPRDAAWILHRMIEEDRLYSYREIGGVDLALSRLSNRLNARFHRGIRLQDSIPGMVVADAELEQDFLEFFPQLVKASRSSAR